jgi:Family of unknown function (DUF6069)
VAQPPYVHRGADGNGQPRVRVDAGRLWMGGLVTAVVAALVAVVGVLIARGLLEVPVLAPTREGTLGNANTARLALAAAVAALAATGLMHLLLVSTPRPFRFFSWIVSLLTLVAVLAPFMTDAKLDTRSPPPPSTWPSGWPSARCSPGSPGARSGWPARAGGFLRPSLGGGLLAQSRVR